MTLTCMTVGAGGDRRRVAVRSYRRSDAALDGAGPFLAVWTEGRSPAGCGWQPVLGTTCCHLR